MKIKTIKLKDKRYFKCRKRAKHLLRNVKLGLKDFESTAYYVLGVILQRYDLAEALMISAFVEMSKGPLQSYKPTTSER